MTYEITTNTSSTTLVSGYRLCTTETTSVLQTNSCYYAGGQQFRWQWHAHIDWQQRLAVGLHAKVVIIQLTGNQWHPHGCSVSILLCQSYRASWLLQHAYTHACVLTMSTFTRRRNRWLTCIQSPDARSLYPCLCAFGFSRLHNRGEVLSGQQLDL